jgi:hypothetical protein
MNRRIWMLAAALTLAGLPQPLHAGTPTWFGFQIGVSGGDAPPPVAFRGEPHVIVVDDVQVVEDSRCADDMFRADDVWWRLRGGYWYRASSWRGPWLSIDVRRVPRQVLVVPARHWKHRPYYDSRRVVVREERHDRGRHRGHDRGRGHERDDRD